MPENGNTLDRRRFLQNTAIGIGAAAAAGSLAGASDTASPPPDLPANVDPKNLIWRNKHAEMDYRRLGRTNFMSSRIVAGWIKEPAVLRRYVGAGINNIDTARGYGEYEVELRDLLAKNRDNLWVTSKATNVAGFAKIDDEVQKLFRDAMKAFIDRSGGDLLALHQEALEKQTSTGEKPDLRPAGKRIAELYASKLDESLDRMKIDHVDSYFVHGVEIPWMFDCLELWEAYEKAHKAGKVKHFGFSTHKHQKHVLAAAVEANKRGPWKIDLTMPGVNPESFDSLKDELAALKKQDVGVIAMKTKGIANRPVDGREKKFEALMGGKEYNEWERAKLWMLHLTEGLVDCCIAAVGNTEEMARTIALPMVKMTAAAERELRALVKLEMAGTCHLCGDCETHCPEHIAVTDMIRYHAYIHQYNEKDLARSLYRMAGYDPMKVCNSCGKCASICPSDVPITSLLHQLSVEMA